MATRARSSRSKCARFGAVSLSDDKDHAHVQSVEVRRGAGPVAAGGADGELIASGHTWRVVEAASGVKVFAGLAPDLFAGDATALGEFRTAFFEKGMFHPQAFQNRKNFFAGRNVSAIVLEVPTSLVGKGLVHGWATASLYDTHPTNRRVRQGGNQNTNRKMLC
jgi:hypothetical protein